MRSEFLLFRRTLKNGKMFYVKFWNYEKYDYDTPRSVGTLKNELGHKARLIPHTSKTGARKIVEMWLEDGAILGKQISFLEYVEGFWTEGGEYWGD